MSNVNGTMAALVLHAPNKFSVDKVDIPKPGPMELLCRVDAAMICGTDPHIIKGEYPGFWPKAFPHVLGHEWAGTVVGVGEGANLFGWEPGDRVAGTSHVGCGYCMMCRRGRYNLCENYGDTTRFHKHYGHNYTGCYAEYVVHSVKSVIRIPDEMPIEIAAAIDPVSIAMHTAKRANIRPGDDVVILGSGSMGLFALQCVKVLGAGSVIVVGSGQRLETAKAVGADEVVDYRKTDVVEEILKMTGGRGVPSVIECAGTPQSIQNSVEVTFKGGTISIIGIPIEPVALNVKKLVLDEIDFRGARANQNEQEEVVPLMLDGRIDAKTLITHTYHLQKFEAALDTFLTRKDGAVKVVIDPHGAL
ncbi:MAG: zinc-binding dehydrogenase [Chloroflexota bacterium]